MMELNDDLAVQWWMDHLGGTLPGDKKQALDEYLLVNPGLHAELIAQGELWNNMEALEKPEPSDTMDHRFQAMLAGYIQAKPQNWLVRTGLSIWFQKHWQVAISSLAVGLIIGAFVIDGPDKDVKSLNVEVQEMKKLLMLTLIDKPLPQERIKAVNLTHDMPMADAKVTEALISTLNHDPSINVRLAAVEALISYGNQSRVREALIQSITKQDSPLLQVALADAMVALQEKSAVDSFSKMLESDTINESVKSKLKFTIKALRSI